MDINKYECDCDCDDCYCDDDSSEEDIYKIQERSEKIIQKLTKQYPDDEEAFLIAVQKESTKMILDIMDEAFVGKESINKKVKNFRDEFFVDVIDYKNIISIAKDIAKLVESNTTDFILIEFSQMLIKALEGQKQYKILKFK
jgi:hypothetical protein